MWSAMVLKVDADARFCMGLAHDRYSFLPDEPRGAPWGELAATIRSATENPSPFVS